MWGSQGLLLVPQMDSTFISAQSALALVPTLVHPDPSAWVSLAVDASDFHVGAVFQQLVQVFGLLFSFYFKKFSSVKTPYSVFDRELMAT